MSNKILDIILSLIFEKLPILKALSGYKTEIGKAAEFLSAFVLLLQHSFPALPYIDQVNGWMGIILGIVLKYVGEAHASSKERRGIE